MELLGLIPGLKLDAIQGNLYCCGLAGVMGFKRDFHEASIELGSRLIEKIKEMNPEILVTDCLSCRLQFNQLLPTQGAPPGRNSLGGIQGRGAGCTALGARVKTILLISRRITAYALQDEAGADNRFTWFKREII